MSESTKLSRRSENRSKYDTDSDSDTSRRASNRQRQSNKDKSTRPDSDRHRNDPKRADDDSDSRDRKAGRRDRGSRHHHGDSGRSNGRSNRDFRERSRSSSPPVKKARHSDDRSRSPIPHKRSRAPLPSQNESFQGTSNGPPPVEKEKPNYKPTGLLAKEANRVAGTTTILKYHEPPEGRKSSPKDQWRMYVFKKKDLLDTVYLYEKSVWLFGRDQHVTDLLLEHPSVSKQHAVIQFRYITTTNEFGDKSSKVKPYLLDLESANGTKLNGKKVEASRYVELVDGDVVGFGNSEREYVMMLPPKEK